MVQRLTGLSRPNEVIENGKRPMNDVDVDHRCKGSSSSFNPIHECYLTSHPYLVDMPYPYLGHDIPNYLTDLSLSLVPNSTYLSLSPLPVYTYAETISFSTLPNIGSSISLVRNEFLDIGTINNGFGLWMTESVGLVYVLQGKRWNFLILEEIKGFRDWNRKSWSPDNLIL